MRHTSFQSFDVTFTADRGTRRVMDCPGHFAEDAYGEQGNRKGV